MNIISFLFFFSLTIVPSLGSFERNYTFFRRFAPGTIYDPSLYWNINETHIEIGLTAKSLPGGYLAMGLLGENNLMNQSDIVVGSEVGIFDYWAEFRDLPKLDDSQDIEPFHFERINNTIFLEWTRLLDTGDNEEDYVIDRYGIENIGIAFSPDSPVNATYFLEHIKPVKKEIRWDTTVCLNNCSGNGICINAICNCTKPYGMVDCSVELVCYDDSDCSNQGSCIDGFCDCNTGFGGLNCSEVIVFSKIYQNSIVLTLFPFPYKLYWNVNTTFLELALEANTLTGWLGLGFSPITESMKDADIFMGYFNGTVGVIKDYWGTGLEQPLLDPNQAGLRLISSKRDVAMILEFERDFNTGDTVNDHIINPDSTIPLLWAIGVDQPVSPTNFQQHEYQGVTLIRFSGGCPNDCSNRGNCTENGQCICDPGFAYVDCSRDACISQEDCNNNGNCTNGVCECFTGFAGDYCQVVGLTPDLNRQEYTFSATFFSGIVEVFWKFVDAEQTEIEIVLYSKRTGWVGLGIGKNMRQADIVIGSVSQSQVTVNDYWSTANVAPSRDVILGGTNDILAFVGQEVDGETIIKYRRKIDTGDEQFDKKIENRAQDCILAYHSTSDNLVIHTDKAQITINFFTGETSEAFNYFKIHGILMAVAWGALIALSGFLPRFFKSWDGSKQKEKMHNLLEKHSWLGFTVLTWFRVHVIMNIIAFVLTIVGFIYGVIGVDNASKNHFNQETDINFSHAWIGLFIVGGMILQTLIGWWSDKRWTTEYYELNPQILKDKVSKIAISGKEVEMESEEDTKIKYPNVRTWPDRIHWWIGRLLIVAAVANIFLGFSALDIDSQWWTIYSVWLGFLALFWIILEILKALKKI